MKTTYIFSWSFHSSQAAAGQLWVLIFFSANCSSKISPLSDSAIFLHKYQWSMTIIWAAGLLLLDINAITEKYQHSLKWRQGVMLTWSIHGAGGAQHHVFEWMNFPEQTPGSKLLLFVCIWFFLHYRHHVFFVVVGGCLCVCCPCIITRVLIKWEIKSFVGFVSGNRCFSWNIAWPLSS